MVTEMSYAVTLPISNDFYAKAAVLEAKSKFSQYLRLELKPQSNGLVTTVFRVPEKYAGDEREIILECLNYMLDRTIQIMLEKEAS